MPSLRDTAALIVSEKKNMNHFFTTTLFFTTLAASLCTHTRCHAAVSLPGFFSDHMVLQQESEIPVWGWCEPGEDIRVTLNGNDATTTGNSSGTWRITLPAMFAQTEPLTLRVEGTNKLEIKDVLIGEVWLCSGQSNMEWTVDRSTNRDAEIAAADYPLIRHIKIARRSSTTPLDDIEADWTVCSPDVAGSYTAAGYFMARTLHKELGVPVGLINSSWGGTRVEPWTPPVGFKNVPKLQSIYQSVIGRTPGTNQYQNRLQQFINSNKAWNQQAESSLTKNEAVKPSPTYPQELKPFTSHQDPTMLYNGMIHALVGFPIRGAIWYQGESNHTEGMLYFEKKKALIDGWRTLWGQGDFPFYYVQIAPYQYGNEDGTVLARFWEAQAAVEQLPNTGMVVINDIATLNDIHPPNKQDVGNRLAMLALKNNYGRTDMIANSPEFESLQLAGEKLVATFKNTGGGLTTRDKQAPTHFELVGPGAGGFVPATAAIEGDTIVLSADGVPEPTAFRFAWDKLAEPNLMGGTGLPAGACRAGEVPDYLGLNSLGKDYELIYELDLNELQGTINYSIDHSENIASFDRIGYLVELESSAYGNQALFVSMDAFTDDVKKIAVPQASVGVFFQQSVQGLESVSTVSSLNHKNIEGNIEFWPNNYAQHNEENVPGASNSLFDFGDSMAEPVDGYGSMQVHNTQDKQTLFAFNHWRLGQAADLGIGNSAGSTRDWTFTKNAGDYSRKRLRIYVRPTTGPK